MCKIKLEAECYFTCKALQMASAVKDTFWESWDYRVTNDIVAVTLIALIVWQQDNYALTT